MLDGSAMHVENSAMCFRSVRDERRLRKHRVADDNIIVKATSGDEYARTRVETIFANVTTQNGFRSRVESAGWCAVCDLCTEKNDKVTTIIEKGHLQ